MAKGERVWKRSVEINYQSTQAFFDARGIGKYENTLSATMYQDHEPELVAKRDLAEKKVVTSLLPLHQIKKVFDMGCGIGRWAGFFCNTPLAASYLGIDFSSSLIQQAHRLAVEKDWKNAKFQIMSVTEVNNAELSLSPPYDFIMISGVLIYLNDTDCLKVLKTALSLCAPNGIVYLREPLAKETRLTLQDVYSEELKNTYSAIYRTEIEMAELIGKVFDEKKFISHGWQELFIDELEKRKETRQYFAVLKRWA